MSLALKLCFCCFCLQNPSGSGSQSCRRKLKLLLLSRQRHRQRQRQQTDKQGDATEVQVLPISTTNLIAQLKQETEDTDDTKKEEGTHSSQLTAHSLQPNDEFVSCTIMPKFKLKSASERKHNAAAALQ